MGFLVTGIAFLVFAILMATFDTSVIAAAAIVGLGLLVLHWVVGRTDRV